MLELYDYKISADGVTFLVALVCAVVRFGQNCWHRSKTTSKDLVSAVLNGASIFPFCLMIGGVFSPDWLSLAVMSKASLAIAGFVGLLFVLGDVISPESLRAVINKEKPAANDDSAELFTAVDGLHRELSPAEKSAVKDARVSKRIPKDIDKKLLSTCRQHLARSLQHGEKVAARKRLLDIG